MTTNKPEVVAYRYTASRSFGKRNPKWHYQESFPHAENRKVEEIGRLEKLISLSDYESLQAECEKLRKDAARYRWLRDSCIDNSESAYIGVWHEESGRYVDTFIDREAIDAAIDAAIQEYNPC